MMRVIVLLVDAKVQHECRARVTFLLEFFVGPFLSLFVRNKSCHSMSKVCIDNDFVGKHFFSFDTNSSHSFSFIYQRLYRRVEVDFDTHLFCNFRHSSGDASEAAFSVEYPVFIFQESENGEQ